MESVTKNLTPWELTKNILTTVSTALIIWIASTVFSLSKEFAAIKVEIEHVKNDTQEKSTFTEHDFELGVSPLLRDLADHERRIIHLED